MHPGSRLKQPVKSGRYGLVGRSGNHPGFNRWDGPRSVCGVAEIRVISATIAFSSWGRPQPFASTHDAGASGCTRRTRPALHFPNVQRDGKSKCCGLHPRRSPKFLDPPGGRHLQTETATGPVEKWGDEGRNRTIRKQIIRHTGWVMISGM
jgi:hypothetical protein